MCFITATFFLSIQNYQVNSNKWLILNQLKPSIYIKKSAHSHCALCAQLASLSAPRACDLIVALRAPFFLDLALRARSCALRIHLSLFLII